MKKNMISSMHLDIKKIKKDATISANKKAQVHDYSLDPKKACQYLNKALATEILCVLRYRHHQVIAKGINSKEIAEEFAEHAAQEEKHMMMIAERINQLGGDPQFNPNTLVKISVTEYGSAATLTEMIKDNLIAEQIVISVYRRLIRWFALKDPTTRVMLESILKDEEEHANDLLDLLQ